jgi:hypothetical protein
MCNVFNTAFTFKTVIFSAGMQFYVISHKIIKLPLWRNLYTTVRRWDLWIMSSDSELASRLPEWLQIVVFVAKLMLHM